MQSHCKVKVLLTPTWKNGKSHTYESTVMEPAGNVQEASPPTEFSTIVASPAKKNAGLSTLVKVGDATFVEKVTTVAFGLVAARNPKKLGKRSAAIGLINGALDYKTAESLKKAPFFCEVHGSRRQKKL